MRDWCARTESTGDASDRSPEGLSEECQALVDDDRTAFAQRVGEFACGNAMDRIQDVGLGCPISVFRFFQLPSAASTSVGYSRSFRRIPGAKTE